MRFLLVLATLPLFAMQAPVVLAQSGVAQCIAIGADAERLACYDGLFRSTGANSNALSFELQSEQLIPARPSGRAPAKMTVTCDAGNLTVAFAFAENTLSALGNDTGITLQYDLQAARSRTLPVNATNTAVVMDNTRDAVAFLDGMDGVTNLTARVTPVNSRSLSVRFRVENIAADLAPIRAACGV